MTNVRVLCPPVCLSLACLLGFPAAAGFGQAASSRATVQQELGFEQQTDWALKGWHTNPPGTVTADDEVAHTGRWSARLQRDEKSAGTFSVMTRILPVDFAAGTVELKAFLRLKDVSGFVGLWLRQDADGELLSIENMQSQQAKGTRDWAEYHIALPLNSRAQKLYFGVLMEGPGTLWADDLQLLVDGQPIANARATPRQTALPGDHEFDAGSRVNITALTPVQVENLATLARVWGFLKYHHPALAAGQRHWDYELFRIMPTVLAASNRAQANTAMVAWIDKLGPVAHCRECAKPAMGELSIKPNIEWIRDRETLGAELSERLQRAYENRTGSQFFVSKATGAGNPLFAHEPSYTTVKFPDAGYQMLALFRWWNIVQYWAPDRDAAGQFWPAVLQEFIPKIALAQDKDAYQLVLFELIAKLNDTHANLWSSLQVRPPLGGCWLPAQVRWVENKAVIWRVTAPGDAENAGLKPGDVIEKMDGAAVTELFEKWVPYYADSNEAARTRDLTAFMTRGSCGPAALDVTRAGKAVHVEAARVQVKGYTPQWHDQPGETFRLLSKNVAYVKLSTIKAEDVPRYFKKAMGTKGMVIDIRNYPSAFMPFAMGSMLAVKPTKFVAFTRADLANPGTFRFDEEPVIEPGGQHYGGKVVVLLDEVSQSLAEYTAVALRAMPNTIVVGSTTAGADGDVSDIPLPGGLHTMVSGLGVFYPDHRPTQRVGIVPDVAVTPTITGITAGRDEVLERAVELIEH